MGDAMTRTVQLVLAILLLTLSVSAPRAAGPKIESIYVRGYDGAYIPAAIRKPAGDGPFPAILYIHGGVGGSGPRVAKQILRGRVPEHFHRLGYAGFATDYRRFHFGEDEIRDVTAAYRKLEGLPFVDATRVGVIGGSHGGYLTQMLCSRLSPAAAVSFAGLSDIEGMFYEAGLELRKRFRAPAAVMEELLTHRERARNRASDKRSLTPGPRVPGGNSPLRPGAAGYEVALELGWRYGQQRDAFRAISPMENLDISGPVLYLVGGKDRLRFAGKRWVEALQSRGVVAEYSEHEGMPHGFYWGRGNDPPPQFHKALKVTTDFIERHLSKPITRPRTKPSARR